MPTWSCTAAAPAARQRRRGHASATPDGKIARMAEPQPGGRLDSGPLHEPDVKQRGIGRALRDIILGGQDGLVNVLGVVLGVAAATAQLRIIMAAALAATFSESIAMAGVAYTAALAERDYYLAQLA